MPVALELMIKLLGKQEIKKLFLKFSPIIKFMSVFEDQMRFSNVEIEGKSIIKFFIRKLSKA